MATWQETMEAGHALSEQAGRLAEAGKHAEAADMFRQAADTFRGADECWTDPPTVKDPGKPGKAPQRPLEASEGAKSTGHIGFLEGVEYFRVGPGRDVYKAPCDRPINPATGYRTGATYVALGNVEHFMSAPRDRFPF